MIFPYAFILCIKNKYCRLYFANCCPSKLGKFFFRSRSLLLWKKLLIPCQMYNFIFFFLAGVRRKDGDIWHSRGPLQPQSFGSQPRILATYHQLQTGQKILPSLQSSVPWEYKLLPARQSSVPWEYKIICISSHSWPPDRSENFHTQPWSLGSIKSYIFTFMTSADCSENTPNRSENIPPSALVPWEYKPTYSPHYHDL